MSVITPRRTNRKSAIKKVGCISASFKYSFDIIIYTKLNLVYLLHLTEPIGYLSEKDK